MRTTANNDKTIGMEHARSEMETETVAKPNVSGLDPEVSAYVGLVRMALRDLQVEEVEDLTGGLEADLAELAAESEEPLIARLGEPSAYAAELRLAAGFPPAGAAQIEPAESWWHRDRRVLRERWARAQAEHPWLEKLRPGWWLLRGAVLIWILIGIAGGNAGVVLLSLGAALSFWVGLRQDGWNGWPRRLVIWANVLAALLFLPFLAENRFGGGYVGPSEAIEVVPSEGVYVDGEQPAGFYVYDSSGQRVEGARIFTDRGESVTVDPWLSDDGTVMNLGRQIDTFPVESGNLDGWNGWRPESDMLEWVPPSAIPPAFPVESAPTATGEAEPTATSEAQPTATGESATPQPTPTPSSPPEPTATP